MSQLTVPLPPYALVTPAHNEERVIRKTLASIVNQTHRPLKWVVVDDNSTDGTGKIIRKFAEQYSFIEPLSAPPGGGKHFGSKIKAFNAGYARLAGLEYQFIGNLDADVSF